MKSIICVRLFFACTIAVVLFAGCNGTPTDPTVWRPTPLTATASGGGTEGSRPAGLARVSVPDFSGLFSNIAPGVTVSVKAWRVDATTWWVAVEVLQCEEDLCRTIWYEFIYTIPPTDPGFTIALRDILDKDGDGVWNWQEKFGIDYQQ